MLNEYTQQIPNNPHSDSNYSQIDQQSIIIDKGISSIIKNQTLKSLLINKTPFNRTQKQCRIIADHLKNQPYFQNISKNYKTLIDISNWIEFKYVQAGQYIYKVHDHANSFYILLTGQVHLTYPQKQVAINQNQQIDNTVNNKNTIQSSFYPTSVPNLNRNQSLITQNTPIDGQKLKRLTKHTSLFINDTSQLNTPHNKQLFQQRIVQIIYKGDSFGDLQNTSRRSTNAISKQQSQLLLIKKQYYIKLQINNTKSQNKLKYEILSQIPLLKLLYRYNLQSLIYLFQQIKINYNNIIYQQYDPIKYIYIIYKGQFKLYKKTKNKKQNIKIISENQQQRYTYKNICYKILQVGQILGYIQTYKKLTYYQQTCICKSQQAIILKIDKNKFIKKILSSQNNIDQIITLIQQKYIKKNKEIQQFLKKYQKDIFIRYIHTPSAKSRRINTQSSVYKTNSQNKNQLRKLSTASNNFFNQFNKTIKQQVRSTRISIKKSITSMDTSKGQIPNRIKDIIGIVNQQSNYYKIRKPKQNITLFQFNISKVPIHVKKKYQILFKKQNK